MCHSTDLLLCFFIFIDFYSNRLLLNARTIDDSQRTFKSCCESGIALLNEPQPAGFNNLRSYSELSCLLISDVVRYYNQDISSMNQKECSLVQRGCLLAAKTNCFCKYRKETVTSRGELAEFKLTPFTFDVAQKCCDIHRSLPFENAANLDCCLPEDEGDYDYFIQAPGETTPRKDMESVIETKSEQSQSTQIKLLTESYRPSTTAELSTDRTTAELVTTHTMPITSITTAETELPLPDFDYLDNLDEELATTVESSSRDVKFSTITEPMTAAGAPEIDKSTAEMEIVCEEGFTWNPEKRLCLYTKARCPRGMFLSVKLNMCLPRKGEAARCPPGFEYKDNINECLDVDECKDGILVGNTYTNACSGEKFKCENTNGSFNCLCKDGYRKTDLNECVDIDECQSPVAICRRGFKCTNLLGTYQCSRVVPCGFGYILNPKTQECEDIDECKQHPNICGRFMVCVNVRGAHKCIAEKCPGKQRRNSKGECVRCPAGYVYNEELKVCEDIDECAGNETNCRVFERCVNRPGDFVCEPKLRCEYGYNLNANGTSCDDINECLTSNFNCQNYEICINTEGSYTCRNTPCSSTEIYDYRKHKCSCPSGFRHIERHCIDIDECMEEEVSQKNAEPLCEKGRTCVNLPGTYRCVTLADCPKGFERKTIRDSCTDVDECALGTARCGLNMHCENTIGSYRCLCERGFRSINETACVDIDECRIFRPEESCPDKLARCVNMAGGYKCICLSGFIWHGYPVNSCRDVNECALGTDECGTKHECVNDEGGYHCVCALGYKNSWDNHTCIDVNECLELEPRLPCETGVCINTEGGYHCDCPVGYRLGGNNQCIDIDECAERDDICVNKYSNESMIKCINLQGGYRCVSDSCSKIYTKKMLRDGYQCNLLPKYDCRANDPLCLQGRPIRLENHHIELRTPIQTPIILGEADSSVVTKGTVHVELLEHYAHNMLTNQAIDVKRAMRLRLKPSNSRYIEVLLTKPVVAPVDMLVSVRLSGIMGRLRQMRSTSKFFIYVTDSVMNRTSH